MRNKRGSIEMRKLHERKKKGGKSHWLAQVLRGWDGWPTMRRDTSDAFPNHMIRNEGHGRPCAAEKKRLGKV